MSTNWKRWTPVAVVPAVVVAAAVALPLSATAAGDLPERSAADLLAFVAQSETTAFSGEIQQTSDLGLPDLSGLATTAPTAADASATNALVEFATGSHQARVYVDAEQGVRFQVLDRLAERDVIATPGGGVWVYDSNANSATHVLPPDGAAPSPDAPAEQAPVDGVLTPSAAAERLLSSIDPTTSVAVGSDVRVAGRDAYELVLTPRDSTTLVGSATVSVDGETGLPLGVAVTARGATAPAFSIAYTSIDLSTPDASLFSFTPPAGAEVIEQGAPEQGTTDAPTPAPDAPVDTNREDVTTTGTGWGTIVELPAGDPGALGPLEAVTTPTEGGRVLSSALVTVLLTDDGRVLAGSVPVEALRDAAAAR